MNDYGEDFVEDVDEETPRYRHEPPATVRGHLEYVDVGSPIENKKIITKSVQWATSDGVIFTPVSSTTNILPPAFYEINSNPHIGLYFEQIPIKTENILDFKDSVTHEAIKEIDLFWESEYIFKEYNLSFRRGLLFYGNAGTGKSCTFQLISKKVIERGGIVIKFTEPGLFNAGLRKLREIQPDTCVVVLMEDLEALLRNYNESEILNTLDGIGEMRKIVFLASTNYPSALGNRILARPSRFDRVFRVNYISEESRKIYFDHLAKGHNLNIDFDKWAKETKEFSIAFLKELFVSVVVLQHSYEEVLLRLKNMKRTPKEDDGDDMNAVGFRKNT